MEDDEIPSEPVLPPVEGLQVVPRTVVPAGESEVVAMLAEQTRFDGNNELKDVAKNLLGAGYTVATTARRLGIRPTTVWSWSKEPEFVEAIQDGAERRQQVLGEGLQEAAEAALSALLEVATDVGAQPRDRVKASEAILDRCGITPQTESAETRVGVTVDVDFDERLARIVAGGAVSGAK
jgi:transposase-like protein